jgi:hypothetical protein
MDAIWEELVYTEARLLADPNASDLASQVQSLLTQHDEVRRTQYTHWRAEIVAQAHVDAADEALDTDVIAVGDELARSDRDRSEPRTARYLGKLTARKIAAQALESELTVVRSWPASLVTEEEPGLKATGMRLRASVERGERAVQERSAVQNQRKDFMSRDKVKFVAAVNAVRLDVNAELARRIVPNKLARRWNESFFRKDTATKSSEATKPAAATKPTETKPAETKSAETKPAETKPSATPAAATRQSVAPTA